MTGELTRQGILYRHDDIHVLRTTMPFPLRESNAFIVESSNGWTVVDTGVNIPENRERWKQALKEIGISFRHVKKIYLTHYHHDHLGLAGWLQQNSQAEVYLPQEDVLTFQTYISTDHYRQAVEATCLREGWTFDLINDLARDVQSIEPLVNPYPHLTPVNRQHSLQLGEYHYQLLPIPGHSDGHYAFFSSRAGYLFAGDNLIQHTILHLTDWPHTRLGNPLQAHLQALQQLYSLEVKWVFPGHGRCFAELTDKIDLIKQHHRKRQDQVLQELQQPSTAWDLARRTFRDNPYIHIKRLILAETLAYLYALVEEKLVTVEQAQGVNRYHRAASLGSS